MPRKSVIAKAGKPLKSKPTPTKVGALALAPTSSLSPFSNRLPFTLKYGDVWYLNGGSGVKVQSFRMNSIYDPDITGAGGTPTYAAQLAEIYESYKVESVDIKAEFFSFNTGIVQQIGMIWHPSNEGPVSSATQIQQILMEGANGLGGFIAARGSNGPTPKKTFTKHLDLSIVEGAILDDAFRANFGSNPAKVLGLDVVAIDPVGITDSAMQVAVTITFHGNAFGRLSNTYTD